MARSPASNDPVKEQYFKVSKAPGFGIELDRKLVERYRVA